jgi:MFS transporter, Spinster family, sphingosine-1-phosphate transporter
MGALLQAQRKKVGTSGHWRIVVVLMLIYMYAFVDRVILSLLVDPIRVSLGASDVQMSLLFGLAFAGFYCACNIPSGYFADRVNRRLLLAVASVFWSIMTMLCGMAHTYSQLFIARAGVGVAEGVIGPTSFSLIRDAVPSRSRALAFSIYGMAPMLGGAVSLTSGGLLLRAAANGAFASQPLLSSLAPWQCTLVIVGLLGLPISLLLLTFREPPRLGMPLSQQEGIIRGMVTASQYMVRMWRIYLPLLTFSAFGTMMSFANTAWFPTGLSRYWHLTPQQIGPPLGVMTLVGGIIGLLFGGWIMNRSIERGGTALTYGIFGVTGTALGVVMAFAAPSLHLAYVGIQGCMFFLGVSFAAGATTLGEITPISMMGRVSAVYLVIQTVIGQTVGPFTVAAMSQALFGRQGNIPVALSATMMAFASVCIVAALALNRQHRVTATES